MSIHTLRRMRGTRWVQLVVDPKTVQEMMGHKDMRTAMGYLHWNQQHGADAVSAAQEKENQEYEAAKNVQAIEKVAGEKRETEATPLTSGASSDGSM